MRVKICGLTNLDDALAALEAGADLLGFTFYARSPRAIAPEACAAITPVIRGRSSVVHLVGLFVNEAPARITEIMSQCGLDLAQLHGDETAETLAALNGRAYKAFRGISAEHSAYAAAGPGQPAFLIDAHVPGQYGGTGQVADWAAARPLAARYPFLLAGGLTPGNVADAIAQAQPWGVDVASGVEAAPGKKDYAKVKAFIQRAKGASDPMAQFPDHPTEAA